MAEPRHIVHVLPWSGVGGTEIATLRIAQTLPPEEFRHIALCAAPSSEAGRVFSTAGLLTEGYTPPYLSLKRPDRFVRSSWLMARTLGRLRADLVHCADVTSALQVVLAGRMAGIPVVSHVRNPYPRLPLRYRPVFRGISRFVFVSHHTRESFAFRVPDARSVVIYDGIDTAQHPHLDARAAVLGQLGLPPASRLVGMVARLAPQKDHETLLRAAGRFLHDCPTAHLLIIGEHSESTTSRAIHDALRRLADEVGIGSRVTFTGFRRDIPHVLAALEVVVLATHFEGLPLVLLEAMAQARPIVATAVGGVPELIINDETGLLCRRRDPEQLAQAVLSVLTDEPRALRLAEGAQRLVKSRFTMERFSSAMAALYRDLLP